MFKDRKQAGQLLAAKLVNLKRENPVVLVVPRGGAIVGAEIAQELAAPMDVVISRKIGAPQNPEVAIGAVTPDGEVLYNRQLMTMLKVNEQQLAEEIASAKTELARRLEVYRQNRIPQAWQGRTVILVDDGIATGFTVAATVDYIRRQQPSKLILAVPVAPVETAQAMRSRVDELVCLIEAEVFYAVGQFYQEFQQTEEQEVLAVLQKYATED